MSDFTCCCEHCFIISLTGVVSVLLCEGVHSHPTSSCSDATYAGSLPADARAGRPTLYAGAVIPLSPGPCSGFSEESRNSKYYK